MKVKMPEWSGGGVRRSWCNPAPRVRSSCAYVCLPMLDGYGRLRTSFEMSLTSSKYYSTTFNPDRHMTLWYKVPIQRPKPLNDTYPLLPSSLPLSLSSSLPLYLLYLAFVAWEESMPKRISASSRPLDVVVALEAKKNDGKDDLVDLDHLHWVETWHRN